MAADPISGAFSNSDVDALESIVTFNVRNNEVCWISFVVGTASLTAISFDFRLHAAGDWFVIGDVSADFTSPEGPILGASADLTTAASGATIHWVRLDVRGVHEVRVRAAGTNSTITGHFGAN